MKKILVTGATGFIGNYVINKLLQNNYNVIATSANSEKAKTASWYSEVKYIPFDLRDLDNTLNYNFFFEEPDLLIHLAWEGLPNYNEDFHVMENLPTHVNFIKNLLQNGLKDITVAGTCLEYGMKEGCLSEEMECKPTTSYAIAKNELRKKLESFNTAFTFNLKWLRLFYTYGKGQSSKSLISQLDTAIKNNEQEFKMSRGDQVRDFLPVEKMAEYIVAVALQQKITGIINCCSGRPVTVKNFVKDYLKKRKKHILLNSGYYPYPDYEAMQFWGDCNKLRSIISDD